jgi:hypothetical protein
MGGIGPRRTGGDIFSNVNAGTVVPLFVELKHSWKFPQISLAQLRVTAIVPSRPKAGELFKHVLCQICDNPRRIADFSPQS